MKSTLLKVLKALVWLTPLLMTNDAVAQTSPNRATMQFLVNIGGPVDTALTNFRYDTRAWYAARVIGVSSTVWPFAPVGSLTNLLCVDKPNAVGYNAVWTSRVNFLSNANYKSMRYGHFADAEARYKKVAYLYNKIPTATEEQKDDLYDAIYVTMGQYKLADIDTPYLAMVQAVLNEANRWYTAGAYGFNWADAAVLTDTLTSFLSATDTAPAAKGTQEFMLLAKPQFPVIPVWRTGQRVSVFPYVTTANIITDGQRWTFTAYARTSTGTPVVSPAFTWTLRSNGDVSIASSNSSSLTIVAKSVVNQLSTARVIASWSTLSGTFRDSVTFSVRPFAYTLPWQPNQQVLIYPKDTLTLRNNSTKTLVAYARSSTGVIVSNPKITFSSTVPGVRFTTLTSSSVQMLVSGIATEMNIPVTASWVTSSGTLRWTILLPYKP